MTDELKGTGVFSGIQLKREKEDPNEEGTPEQGQGSTESKAPVTAGAKYGSSKAGSGKTK